MVALKALSTSAARGISSRSHPRVARPEVTGTCSWLKFIALNFLFILFPPFMPLIKGVIFSSPHPLPPPLPSFAELKTNPETVPAPGTVPGVAPRRDAIDGHWCCRRKALGGAGATFISHAHQYGPLLKIHSQPTRAQCRPAVPEAGAGSVRPVLVPSLPGAARPGELRASLPAPAGSAEGGRSRPEQPCVPGALQSR